MAPHEPQRKSKHVISGFLLLSFFLLLCSLNYYFNSSDVSAKVQYTPSFILPVKVAPVVLAPVVASTKRVSEKPKQEQEQEQANDLSTSEEHDKLLHILYNQWEIDSITGTCNPPKGTPQTCCLGSISKGGGVSYKHWKSCTNADYGSFDAADRDDDSMDVILHALASKNKTLTLTGDSVMYQQFVGMECEWLSRGYVSSVTLGEAVDLKEEMKTLKLGWRYGVSQITQHVITVPNKNTNEVNFARINFYFQYRPIPGEFKQFAQLMDSTDVAVINFGVHWLTAKDTKGYEREMGDLFDFLFKEKDYGKTKTIVWRETFAQHFNSTGGEYGVPRLGKQCEPNIDYNMAKTGENIHQVREIIIKKAIERSTGGDVGIVFLNETKSIDDRKAAVEREREREGVEGKTNTVLWLPATDVSAKTWGGLHPQFGDKCEGTHYCHTKYIWMNLWKELAKGVELF
jgi:hypothetical protein